MDADLRRHDGLARPESRRQRGLVLPGPKPDEPDRRLRVLRAFVVKNALVPLRPIVQESLTTASYLHHEATKSTKMTLIDSEPYSRRVIACAIEVHRTLGPGLIESVYEACLCHELTRTGIAFVRQQTLPVVYKGQHLDCNLTMDVVVEQTLVLEIKSVNVIHPIHEAQLLTYLKLSGLRTGLLLNFNEVRLIDGVRRRLL